MASGGEEHERTRFRCNSKPQRRSATKPQPKQTLIGHREHRDHGKSGTRFGEFCKAQEIFPKLHDFPT